MRKAGFWLLFAVSILMAASRAQANEVFWGVLGTPFPPSLTQLDTSPFVFPLVLIIGMQPSEEALGIAVRPATGDLYLVGTTSRLYRVSTDTGVATAVGPPFTPSSPAPSSVSPSTTRTASGW